MYADFAYYKNEYCGMLVDETAYPRLARQASRYLDTVTTNKLQFAFPIIERDALTVKDCQCDLIEFLFQVQKYQSSAQEAVGSVTNADGTVRGKNVSSITSGSESISFSHSSGISTAVSEAAKSNEAMMKTIYDIVKSTLSCVSDANGVNLLYAGTYPGKRGIWV